MTEPIKPITSKIFACQLENAARAVAASIDWQSSGWVAKLQKNQRTRYVIGYTFPINNAASAQIAHDKVATYFVLDSCSVPAVPHYIMRFALAPEHDWVDAAMRMVDLPLVVKPHAESAGIDVLRAFNRADLKIILYQLAQRYRAIALSPYVDIEHEFRVVMLDSRARIVYEKIRQPLKSNPDTTEPEWRHNLRRGAESLLIHDRDMLAKVVSVASKAMSALELRFAAVDIVDTQGTYKVLEVNSSVLLERFSASNIAHAHLAAEVYRDAIQLCFTGSDQ